MNKWFSWQTAVGAMAIGVSSAYILFSLSSTTFTLSGSDLFFAGTAIISLGFNVWQLFRDRYKYTPLKNSLIGLFNDLKNRQLRAYNRQQLIFSTTGLATPVDSLRVEYYDSLQGIIQGLEQLREHVVANIHTLDPNASSQQVFRASEFGLTNEERELQKQNWRRLTRPSEGPQEGRGGGQTPPTESPASSIVSEEPQSP